MWNWIWKCVSKTVIFARWSAVSLSKMPLYPDNNNVKVERGGRVKFIHNHKDKITKIRTWFRGRESFNYITRVGKDSGEANFSGDNDVNTLKNSECFARKYRSVGENPKKRLNV